jgi:tetratricopeptide (TPR) repeat protein
MHRHRSPVPAAGLVAFALLSASVAQAQSFRVKPEDELMERVVEGAPMSLTASDGTGLALVRLHARAVVEGPLAFTELRLGFKNPRPRTIEGRFAITLPENAALSRFAMKLADGRWQEGEVVEKEAARRAYEDFLHRRQDPALLEQGAGNEFTARVFPIPANGVKELIVSWSHTLPGADASYRLPLRGLPEIADLDVRVHGQGGKALVRKGWVPDRDFVLAPAAGRARALRSGNFVIAEVEPVARTKEDRVPSLTILVDSSASRALGLPRNAKLVEGLARALARGQGAKTPLQVVAFDQGVEVIYDGAASGFDRAASKKILRRRALGASNLELALSWAAKNAKGERLVLLTDGVATAGATDLAGLDRALTALANSKRVKRVDAVATGGLRDSEMLRGIVSGHAARDGAVIDGDQPLHDVTSRLVRAVRSGLRVQVKGARWVWPETLDSVQPGDRVLIFAALPKGRALDVRVGGRALKVGKAAQANKHLVARTAAQAEIARLVHQRSSSGDKDARARLKKQIVELSVESRVMSPFTSLLVLETEQDYARYGIARRGLADILVVDARGLQLRKRTLKELPKPKPVVKKPPTKRGKAKKKSAARSRAREGEAELDFAADEDDADSFEGGNEGLADGAPAEMDEMEEAKVAETEAEPSAEPPPPPATSSPEPRPRARPRPRRDVAREERAAPAGAVSGPADVRAPERPKPAEADPYTGPFAEVMKLLKKNKTSAALAKARGWRDEDPGDVMALVALGEAYTAAGDYVAAARAYGSLIDLFAGRADIRRFAGQRLEALSKKYPAAMELAVDTYRHARAQRPDHPASHHLLAFALVKRGAHEEAFDVLVESLQRSYPSGRFAGVRQILAEDLGLVAAAWSKAAPKRAREISGRLRSAGGVVENKPSLRFVLSWETDANDVDFHIYDAKGGHAYYSQRSLPSGGSLYADVTTGYGPECFTIRNPEHKRAGPYTLQAHYYSRGPMGYGMGKLQVIEHDGKGRLTFDERPFVVMKDGAYLDLGTVKR